MPRVLVSQVWAADSTSTSSIEVTKLLGPPSSKATTVRALVVAAVTPNPKTAWLTRWPAAKAGSISAASAATVGLGDGVLVGRGRDCGGLRGAAAAVAGVEGVQDHRFGTGVWSSR